MEQPYNVLVIGSCSICGGRVTVPAVYWSVVPPTPTCEDCGAVEDKKLPVVPMKPCPRLGFRGMGWRFVPLVFTETQWERSTL